VYFSVITSIIIPLDLSRRPSSLFARIVKLAHATATAGLRLIIGHANRGSVYDGRLGQMMREHPHVAVVEQRDVGRLTNLALLRNLAANEAEEGVLIFLDADIDPNTSLFNNLAAQVISGAPLAMAPCLYLSQEGTQALASGFRLDAILQSALNFSPSYVTHWALPSSVMAIHRSDFRSIDGFFEGYHGHGYEDFDFITRLALAKQLIKPSPYFLMDRTYRAPFLSEGFRGELGVLCLANLLLGNVAAHLFHERDNHDAYYIQRTANAELFQQRAATLLGKCTMRAPLNPFPTMVAAFYEECQRQSVDPSRFHALFDARPRHLLYPRSFGNRVLLGVKRIYRSWADTATW
jgi:predicted glycosyltransferase involved in capsule biosynthesis